MTRKGLSPLQVYIDTIRVISRYQRLEYTEAQSLLLISLRKGSGGRRRLIQVLPNQGSGIGVGRYWSST